MNWEISLLCFLAGLAVMPAYRWTVERWRLRALKNKYVRPWLGDVIGLEVTPKRR